MCNKNRNINSNIIFASRKFLFQLITQVVSEINASFNILFPYILSRIASQSNGNKLPSGMNFKYNYKYQGFLLVRL